MPEIVEMFKEGLRIWLAASGIVLIVLWLLRRKGCCGGEGCEGEGCGSTRNSRHKPK